MSLFSKFRGTIETIFQIGLGGPNIKNNAGVIEARNAGDSAFAVVRGATPVGDNDLVNKQYADTLASRSVVTAQFDGSTAIPANTGVERFLVVSTSGVNANIGDLLWDDGTAVGNMVKLVAVARSIITTVALSGGTISFSADSQYFWDTGSTSWINIGGTSLSGSLRSIQYAVTNAASQDSASKVPANAFVRSCLFEVTTPYSGGATVSIGQAGSLALLQATTDNLATVVNQYEVQQRTAWGASALAIRTTVAGAPAAGAGVVNVTYELPDA